MNSIISMRDFDKLQIEEMLEMAQELEENPKPNLLKGKIISSLFFEPSTRTRLSFYSAAQRLGAQVLGFDSTKGTSLEKGESLGDTIKMAEGYSDIVVMRHPINGSARLAKEKIRKPVINAGDGSNQHPSQTLLDLYTIKKERGTLENLKIAFVGDLKHGRTVHSLAQALALYNSTIYFVAPEELQMPNYIIEDIKDEIKYEKHNDFKEILNKIDVLYMTRIQKERFEDKNEYEKTKGTFVINKENIIGKCKQEMIIMHPLPRVDEMNEDLDDTKHARYFEQAANGVPVRQAMLIKAMGLGIRTDKESIVGEEIIEGKYVCETKNCISNHQKMNTKFIDKGEKIRCLYCEKTFEKKQA